MIMGLSKGDVCDATASMGNFPALLNLELPMTSSHAVHLGTGERSVDQDFQNRHI